MNRTVKHHAEPICCICKSEGTDKYRLCRDHDHTTGFYRGVLCDLCNSYLGIFEWERRRQKRSRVRKFRVWAIRFSKEIEKHLKRKTPFRVRDVRIDKGRKKNRKAQESYNPWGLAIAVWQVGLAQVTWRGSNRKVVLKLPKIGLPQRLPEVIEIVIDLRLPPGTARMIFNPQESETQE